MLSPNEDLDSSPYWKALREHRVAVQSCRRCHHRWIPATPGCPYCAAPADEAVEVIAANGQGRVYSFVTVHRALSDNMRDEAPYIIATIDLDGGGRLFARIDSRRSGGAIGATSGAGEPAGSLRGEASGAGATSGAASGDGVAIGDAVEAAFVDHDTWTELRFVRTATAPAAPAASTPAATPVNP